MDRYENSQNEDSVDRVGRTEETRQGAADIPARASRWSKVTFFPACILLSSLIAIAFGAGTTGLLVVATVTSILCGVFLVNAEQRARQSSEKRFRETQAESAKWRAKWGRLQAESGQATTVLQQLSDGVVVLSGDGTVLLMNPASKELFSLSQEHSYHGRSFLEIVRDPRIQSLINDSKTTGGSEAELLEVTDGTGVRPVRIDVKPIEAAGAQLLIIRDETESRRVDEIRREFVANVSHELKTPLAAIKGYAETVELAIQDDPESAFHFMKQILSQCYRLERLVADMMQLARAQSGKHNMTLSQVSLREVIDEAFRSCLPIAETKQIELKCGYVDAHAEVKADKEATLAIANNLISNAVRYTPSGGHVEIRTEPIDGYWTLVVQDDGVGIPESEQQRVFERFYRVAKTRQSTHDGTGIGLSIVKNLTHAQSGKVQLSSHPGKGSTFRVLLPAWHES